MLDVSALGSRIKMLREEKEITQKEFALILHVSPQAVSNWERAVSPPDLENLMRISRLFSVSVDELLDNVSV